MDKHILVRAAEYFKKKKIYSRWQKIVVFLAAIVVFCTTYALILPAITMEKTLVCMVEEHVHTEECYIQTEILDCEKEEMEGHVHGETCYLDERKWNCQKQETEGHVHGEACFGTERVLNCELETVELQEGHTHDETCYEEEKTLTCLLEENEEHTHEEQCYTVGQKLICLLEESEPVEIVIHEHTEGCYIEQTVKTCELEEIEAHTHDESCYEGEIILVCDLEELEGHAHSEECYHTENVLICEKPEHTHIEECYASSKSDPTADVETAEIWEETFAEVELTGNWAADVLSIAETQLGYTESTKNYIENESGEQSGYTRYGAWYGIPYGDWCAMFVSFCLDYAGVEDFPLESNCQNWIEKLKEETCGLYREAAMYIPKAGDLIFFDWDLDGVSHHMGLVAEVTIGEENDISTVKVIEGNSIHDCVEEIIYDLTDLKIMGYGELVQPTMESVIINELVYDDEYMTVTATFPEEYEIPENAVLHVEKIDEQTNPELFEAMSQSVKDTIITQENHILGSLKLYDICMMVEDQIVEVGNDLAVSLNVVYKEALFNEEEMSMAAELSVVSLEEPMLQTYGLRTLAAEPAGYSVVEQEAAVEGMEAGVTGLSMETYGLQTFGVATETEIKEGNFWKRVEDFSEIEAGDTLMFVSAEGNVALTYGESTLAVPVIMEQEKGNPDYYEVSARSGGASFAENGQFMSSKFTVSNIGSNTLRLLNQGASGQYLTLTNRTVFSTSNASVTLSKQEPENVWKISSGSYYLTYDRDSKMLSSSNSAQARQDMFVMKLVNTVLEIPVDCNNEPEIPEIPEEPVYDVREISPEKSGNTTLTELEGVSVGYASDPATSDLEMQFEKTEEENGKVLTDKSVVYGNDDYEAFSDYAPGTFGVTLSALGQVTSEKGEVKPLMDAVIILDTSYSMINDLADYKDNGEVRMVWAMRAVNEVLDEIMAEPDNRVGLVTFSDTSQVVLPLDHYTTEDGQYLDLVKDTSKNDATAAVNHGRGTNFYDLNVNSNVKNSKGVTPSFDFLYGPGYPNWEGTFTQSGIAEAAEMLLRNADTTDIYGNPRQPVIILISDGGPTLCTSNYRAPLEGPIYGNSGQTTENDHDEDHSISTSDGAAVNRYGINGYYTILTAQYYKNLVGSHYNLKTKFASVGIGIEKDQDSNSNSRLHDNRYCRAVLNPTADNVSKALNTFDGFEHEGKQLNQLLNNTFTEQYVSIPNHSDGFTTIGSTYSAVPVLRNPFASYDYADQYYAGTSATLADDLISYLKYVQYQEHSWRTIIENNTDVMLEDPIGEGMEVKGAPKLRFGNRNYDATSINVDGNVTTYVYNYPVVYTDAYAKNAGADSKLTNITLDLSTIEVTVTTEGEGVNALQTVKMHVPEELLPVFYPEKYGFFYYQEDPVRLIFQVGLTDAVIEDCNQNLNAGEVRTYYTNRWEGMTTTGKFTRYSGSDHPNEYPFEEMPEVLKDPNQTDTISTSFDSSVDGNDITQNLGNNGKLVLTKEATTIAVTKKWSDAGTHDPITVHLLADGKVLEGETQILFDKNNWTYTWEHLTKYHSDGTEISYSVSEEYVPGYMTNVERVEKGTEISETIYTPATEFTGGKEYVLVSARGALAAKSGGKFEWTTVDVNSKERPPETAIWKAGAGGNSTSLYNIGMKTYMGLAGYWSRYFVSNETNSSSVKFSDYKLSMQNYRNTYYFTGINNSGNGTAETSNSSAVSFDLYQVETVTETCEEDTYIITNTKDEKQPLSLTIKKFSETGGILSGAVFDLYQGSSAAENETDAIVAVPGTSPIEYGKLIHHNIAVGSDGKILEIPNQDGVYYLVETKAPEGYMQPTEPIRLTVSNDKISLEELESNEMASFNDDNKELSVINKGGYKLPETGGAGIMWHMGAGLLMIAAVVMGLIKKILK